jgi:hypothetical protein
MRTGVVRVKDQLSSCLVAELSRYSRELCMHRRTVVIGIKFLSFREDLDSVEPIGSHAIVIISFSVSIMWRSRGTGASPLGSRICLKSVWRWEKDSLRVIMFFQELCFADLRTVRSSRTFGLDRPSAVMIVCEEATGRKSDSDSLAPSVRVSPRC